MKNNLVENKDYYYDSSGFVVFTEIYLKAQGDCCGNGCRHCPYEYINVAEPRRSKLLIEKIEKLQQ